MMMEQARDAQGDGTSGPGEAAAEWRRGAAARLEAFGPATEMMLDLVNVAEGNRVLDVGAGAGDSTLLAAQRVGRLGGQTEGRIEFRSGSGARIRTVNLAVNSPPLSDP